MLSAHVIACIYTMMLLFWTIFLFHFYDHPSVFKGSPGMKVEVFYFRFSVLVRDGVPN